MATETKADSSVVMALSELVRLENDRIASERDAEIRRAADARAERERAEAAAKEAERQRAERAAQDARVAEAEARLRVEADRERDQRIAAMRAELARVETERQALREDLQSRAMPREQPRTSGWALAFGLSSLVAASLAGLLVMQSSSAQVAVASTPSTAPVVVAAPQPEIAAPVVTAAPETADETVAVADPTPAHPPVRGRGHGHGHGTATDHGTVEHGHGTDLVGLEEEGDPTDVLGNLATTIHH